MYLNNSFYKSTVSKLSNNELSKLFKTTSKDFLQTKEWKILRKDALNKYGYQCHKCGNKKSLNVDHIKPRKFFPELALDINNLQILCSYCNIRKGNKHCKDYRKK